MTTAGHRPTRIGPVAIDVERSVYGTVVIMTVLAIDTAHGTPTYLDAAVTVLGMMMATFLAHLFADVLSEFAGAPPEARRARTVATLARVDLVFLALTVVPLVVLLIGVLREWEPETAIKIVMCVGVAFLVVVGGIGGRRAGFGRWGIAGCAALTGILGAVLLVIQVFLK